MGALGHEAVHFFCKKSMRYIFWLAGVVRAIADIPFIEISKISFSLKI